MAAQGQRVESARRAASEAGKAANQFHLGLMRALGRSVDRSFVESLDSVARLGIQGAFLFEESSDIPNTLPTAESLAALDSGLDMAAGWIQDARIRIEELGFSPCLPPA
jgi:hypothetical protein